MSDQENKRNNSGALFDNRRKEKDTHPDKQGQATINGVDYWISGWMKTSKGGDKYMSLSFKPKDAPAQPDPTAGW